MVKIGVVARSIPTSTGVQYGINDTYLDAIHAAGGVPIILNLYNVDYVPELDGILLPGGDDMDPKFYGQEKHPKTEPGPLIDDELDLKVIEKAIEAKLPILGICRGFQGINVYFKGDILQHIESGYHSTKDYIVFDKHPVKLTCDSYLTEFMPREYYCNTAHHQAIDKVGEGLKVIAEAEDGVAEAFVHETLPIFGFQWHPERLIKDEIHLQIFKYFVNFCEKNRENR